MNPKTCSQCHQVKDMYTAYYLCAGVWRSECKACTVKRNVKYQKKVNAWRDRTLDDSRKIYMRDYYKNNKDKFAQYRAVFKERNPEYYKDYFRTRKEK